MRSVILAGDLLDLAGHADLDTQIVVVTKYLARIAHKPGSSCAAATTTPTGATFSTSPSSTGSGTCARTVLMLTASTCR